MIFNAIISWFVDILVWMVAILPAADTGLISTITSSFTTFHDLLVQGNYIFPIDHLLIAFTFILSVESSLFLWRLYKWLAQVFSGGTVKT